MKDETNRYRKLMIKARYSSVHAVFLTEKMMTKSVGHDGCLSKREEPLPVWQMPSFHLLIVCINIDRSLAA